MTTILYMIGALLLIGGILVIGAGNPFGAVLLVFAVALFLVNMLRLMHRRGGDTDGDS